MSVSTAKARWEGSLKEGKGNMALGSGAFDGPFSFATRFEGAQGANPEELIGAAEAGCFSMALSAELGKAGYTPDSIETSAEVSLDAEGDGFAIKKISLICQAKVPGVDNDAFQKIAGATKEGCPVSKALQGPEISLEATLL